MTMRLRNFAFAAAGSALLAACATTPPPPPPPPPPPSGHVQLDWQAAIQESDRDRLARLDQAWQTALGQAIRDGHEGDLRALGNLPDPDTALRDPLPPEGNYRCRTVKLGARSNGPGLTFVPYGWFNCKVERTPRGAMKLTKTTGSQRQTGLMFPDSERRGVFLGAMALGDEPPARAYGLNADRDVVGVIERIGAAQWRLVQPWPRYESNLDLLEIVPAT
jgi:hypothetical protein